MVMKNVAFQLILIINLFFSFQLLDTLSDFKDKELLCDVVVVTKDTKFACHKVPLASICDLLYHTQCCVRISCSLLGPCLS